MLAVSWVLTGWCAQPSRHDVHFHSCTHNLALCRRALGTLTGTLQGPLMAAPAACMRAKAEEWLGAQVCSPPAVRGHAALGLGRIVEVNGGNVTVQYNSKTTRIWPLNAPQLVVVGPSEALAQRLAHQDAECWPMPKAGHHSSRAARGLSILQRKVSQMVYEGSWSRRRWRSTTSPPWNSTREAALFHGQSIVLLGASPVRQLAEHFPAQLAGIFDDGPIVEPHSMYASCHQPFGRQSIYARSYSDRVQPLVAGQAICNILPCDRRDEPRRGHGCADCNCCCGCEARRHCSTADFTLGANVSGVQTTLHFSDKPELTHTADDRAAMESRFCRDPPAMLVFQKGVHDAYFDVFTVPAWQFPFMQNGTVKQMEAKRVAGRDHVARLDPLLRVYITSTLSCLPDSTLVVMVTPYHSNKAPWQAPLVQATYSLMVALFEACLHAIGFSLLTPII